jgi:transcriptional regulator with XRE-family HTH domain
MGIEVLTLGRRIRVARKLLGFSQKDSAARYGGLTCDIAAVTKDIPHVLAI